MTQLNLHNVITALSKFEPEVTELANTKNFTQIKVFLAGNFVITDVDKFTDYMQDRDGLDDVLNEVPLAPIAKQTGTPIEELAAKKLIKYIQDVFNDYDPESTNPFDTDVYNDKGFNVINQHVAKVKNK